MEQSFISELRAKIDKYDQEKLKFFMNQIEKTFLLLPDNPQQFLRVFGKFQEELLLLVNELNSEIGVDLTTLAASAAAARVTSQGVVGGHRALGRAFRPGVVGR